MINKIQYHNCLSKKRQFYVYTICRHFICLQCAFCLINFQNNCLRCCYQYTPLSEQLKEVLENEIKNRLNVSRILAQENLQSQKQLSKNVEKINLRESYYNINPIKEDTFKKDDYFHSKPVKISSIYVKNTSEFLNSKDLIDLNQVNCYKNSFCKKQYSKENQKQQKKFIKENENAQIDIQKQKIHKSFEKYHKELNFIQIETVKKLYELNNLNSQKINKFELNFNETSQERKYFQTQQKQNIQINEYLLKKRHLLKDRIAFKLKHFENVLKQRLQKHYM